MIKNKNQFIHKPHAKNNFKENKSKSTSKLNNMDLAMKIHIDSYKLDNVSLGSESGKSEFDEEYYKNQPAPLNLKESHIIEIGSSNQISVDLQRPELPSVRDNHGGVLRVQRGQDEPQKGSGGKLEEEGDDECCCWKIFGIFCGNI